MQPARVFKLVSTFFFGSVILLGVGCQKKSAPPPAKTSNQAAENDRSIYRQAIDEAKSLEKRINDRAIDPEEKARLDKQNPSGQDQ
jgi:hypothetical protein